MSEEAERGTSERPSEQSSPVSEEAERGTSERPSEQSVPVHDPVGSLGSIPPASIPPASGPPVSVPRRLSPLSPVVRGGIFLAATLAATWQRLLSGNLGIVGLFLLGVVVLGALAGVVSWLRTTYWIEGDELRIDTGVVSRQSRKIRIDRLQGVDVVQPVAARLFGVAEVRMDTAGADREGALRFVSLGEANRLRDELLRRRDTAQSSTEGPPPPEGAESWRAPEQVLAVLDLRTLLLSLLFAPATVLLLVGALAVVVAVSADGRGLVVTVLPAALASVLLQLRRLSGYYGFTVAAGESGLQVRRGLLERNTQSIALARVQGVVLTEPFLWRHWGWTRLDVSIAGYGTGGESDGAPAATTVLPVAERAAAFALARYLLHGDDETGLEVDPDAVELSAPPRQARWLDPVGRRFTGAGMGPDVVVSRTGRFTRRTHVARHARIQSLRLSQGPWQRRLGLADVHLDSPPGPTQVVWRHRSAVEALDLLQRARELGRASR